MNEETNAHIAVKCPFSTTVWGEVESKIKVLDIWKEEIVEECLKNSNSNKLLDNYISLPLILTWGIGLALNESCFEDTTIIPIQLYNVQLEYIEFIFTRQSAVKDLSTSIGSY